MDWFEMRRETDTSRRAGGKDECRCGLFGLFGNGKLKEFLSIAFYVPWEVGTEVS